jgi:hypothetical protein
MALERIRETFNDGMLQYGENKTIRSETRKNLGRKFVPSGSLFYRIMTIRESDYLQNDAMGERIDLKLKAQLPPSLRKIDKDKVKIKVDSDLYDVITTDRDNNYLYFYLHRIEGDHVE